jgi:hypothetical protein
VLQRRKKETPTRTRVRAANTARAKHGKSGEERKVLIMSNLGIITIKGEECLFGGGMI